MTAMGWWTDKAGTPRAKPERARKDPPTNSSCPRSPGGHDHSVMSSRRGYTNCRYCGESKWTG